MRNYTLLFIAFFVFLFCVFGLVNFAANSSAAGRFTFRTGYKNITTSLLNKDGTERSLVVPSDLAYAVQQIVFHSSSLGVDMDDPFFNLFTTEPVDALLYLDNLLSSIGGATTLFLPLNGTLSDFNPPPNLEPQLQDQVCLQLIDVCCLALMLYTELRRFVLRSRRCLLFASRSQNVVCKNQRRVR